MTIDLWGEIPEPGKEKTPFTILWEQASLLQKKTKFLQGRVRNVACTVKIKKRSELLSPEYESSDANRTGQKNLCYILEIVVPRLDNYSFGVLIISYNIDTIYPVDIEPLVIPDDDEYDYWESFSCATEANFLEGLKEILGSNEVKKVIQRLLAHIILEKGDGHTDESEE
ncbi:hypothetical protein QUF72_15605 [Desulfobacterales bacterium HSG2]|nr:hypothetical protein [Desulfobacterales bacterium HSG2]